MDITEEWDNLVNLKDFENAYKYAQAGKDAPSVGDFQTPRGAINDEPSQESKFSYSIDESNI